MKNIVKILKKEKALPLDKFINTALYDKKNGYYMKRNPFGKNNDYITSPLVSNLFGEMVAIWCVAFWEHLGKPKKILFVELGPGDGSMCKDLLNTFKNFKNFYGSLDIKLFEKSDKLKKIQKSKIRNRKVKWIKNLNEINYGPIIFFGNEFFDALPIKQIWKKKKVFLEKYVVLAKNKKKIKFLYKKANKNLINNIKKLNLISKENIIEYPVDEIKFINLIAKKIKKYNGGLLTLDYGHTEIKNHNTLRSISNHKYIDILLKPGDADITHNINYNLFLNILRNNNLQVEKIVTQNEFLQKLGIIERANILSKKMNFKKKAEMFYRLKKLIDHKEMGNIFKVAFAKKKRL